MQQYHDTKRFMYRQINISQSREYSEREVASYDSDVGKANTKELF